MGAIGEGGARVVSIDLMRLTHTSADAFRRVEARERAELERRARSWRRDAPALTLADRVAIIVDDGIATGSTARAAAAVAHEHRAAPGAHRCARCRGGIDCRARRRGRRGHCRHRARALRCDRSVLRRLRADKRGRGHHGPCGLATEIGRELASARARARENDHAADRSLHDHLGRLSCRRKPRAVPRISRDEVPRRLRRVAQQVQEPVLRSAREPAHAQLGRRAAQLSARTGRHRRRGRVPEHGAAVLPELRVVRAPTEAERVRTSSRRHSRAQPMAGRLVRALPRTARRESGRCSSTTSTTRSTT